MGSKVLVTGADGFIGSHLVEHLIKKGLSVKAFCLYNSFRSYGWMEDTSLDLKNDVEIVFGDIRDRSFLNSQLEDVECIFNLAALIGIPYSYSATQSYIDTNLVGTLNVLECAKNFNIRVIQTSTSEVYGTAKFVPITEKHPLVAQSPYAATKIAADQLSMSYFRSFDLPVTILRPFNTFGPRQSQRAVIPTIINQILANEEKILLGDVRTTRDFNYVLDTCEAFFQCFKSQKTIGDIFNTCSGFEISIEDTVKNIALLMNKSVEIIKDNNRLRPSKSEVRRLVGSNEKLKYITGWEPPKDGLQTLLNGLEKTIEWNKRLNLSNLKSEYTI